MVLSTAATLVLFGHGRNFFEMTEHVRKYRLVNSVAATFDTIIGQMTEISQRNKKNSCSDASFAGTQRFRSRTRRGSKRFDSSRFGPALLRTV